jgi:glycosyltransferase involved in cell wall biosynthesis
MMPIYNAEEYLSEAIESIIHQTYSHFEFIIISDDTSEKTRAILDDYQNKDERILVYQQKRDSLVASLNRGLRLAKGKYIARMDGDDINLPERFEKQVAFMEEHPDVGICGTWVQTIGQHKGLKYTFPCDDSTIRCHMLFDTAFAHPSVMIRKELIEFKKLEYNPDFKHAEDYEFWVRCSMLTHLANVGEVLMYYRINKGGISQTYLNEQNEQADRVRLALLEKLGIHPSVEEMNLHLAISLYKFKSEKKFLQVVEHWLCKLKTANQERSIYPEPVFSGILANQWFLACCSATNLGIWTWKKYWLSTLSRNSNLNWLSKIKFMIACSINYSSNKSSNSLPDIF